MWYGVANQVAEGQDVQQHHDPVDEVTQQLAAVMIADKPIPGVGQNNDNDGDIVVVMSEGNDGETDNDTVWVESELIPPTEDAGSTAWAHYCAAYWQSRPWSPLAQYTVQDWVDHFDRAYASGANDNAMSGQ